MSLCGTKPHSKQNYRTIDRNVVLHSTQMLPNNTSYVFFPRSIMTRLSEPIITWGQYCLHLIRGTAMLLLLIVGSYILLRFILLCCNIHTRLRQNQLYGSKSEAGCVWDTPLPTHTHTEHAVFIYPFLSVLVTEAAKNFRYHVSDVLASRRSNILFF